MRDVLQPPAPSLVQRRAPVRPASLNDEERTFEVVWTTGAQVRRYSWARDEEFDEELVVEPSALRLDRLNAGAPFLDSHSSWGLGGVLGVVEPGSVRVEDGRGYARIRLSRREGVEEVWQDIRGGIIRNVSVGYRVHRYERIAKGDRTDGGERALYRAVDWEPMEISAVAIGADPAAGVRGEAAGTRPAIEERAMEANTETAAPADISTSAPPAGPPPASGRDATTIRAICARLQLGDTFAEDLLTRGLSLAQARSEIFAELERRDPLQGRSFERAPAATLGGSWDSPDALRRKVADARAAQICQGLGLKHEPTIGRELAGRDTIEHASFLAEARGERGLRSERAVLDFYCRGVGAHGTSDMPIVAASALTIVVGRAVEQAPIALLRCVSRIPTSDWRARNYVHFSSASRIREVLEAGELSYVTVDENGEVLDPPRRKAAGFRATDELIRNAAGQGVALEVQVARSMIEAANEAVRATIGGAILSPPLLKDGLPVFDAARGNIGVDEDVDVDGVGSGRAAMARYLDSQGTPRPVAPAMLLVPPELHTRAEKLVADIAAATVEDVNPFSRALQVLSDPELPADGFWYLVPDPSMYDGLALIHLDDMPGPRIEVREAWETFGVEWRLQWPMAASWLRPTWWRAPVAL